MIEVNNILVICLTAIVIALINSAAAHDRGCLSGHDIDAKIQRDYQTRETAPQLPTPNEKDKNDE